MKTIPLNRGKVALVDDEDYPILAPFTWHANEGGYAATGIPDGSKKAIVLMHRLVLMGAAGIDHINGNCLDNRSANLRPASHRENARNSAAYKTRRDKCHDTPCSVFKGVSWHKGRSKWCARIVVDGRQIYLGQYADERAAARAYDEAAEKYFGEFSRPNFPCERGATT